MENKKSSEYNWKTIFTLLTTGILLLPINEYLLTIGPGTLGDGLASYLLVPVAIVSWPLMFIFVGIFLSSEEVSRSQKVLARLSIPLLAIVSVLLFSVNF